MAPHLTTIALACTTTVALLGWWSASRRVSALQRQVDAYCAEDWHSAEEMAEFAGRCAWHAASVGMMLPPIVEDHLRESFVAGWREEDTREAAETALWNAGVA